MKLSDEYCLEEYEELKHIHDRSNIFIVRNKITGLIAVKKIVSVELKNIYTFLKEHPTPFIPKVFECIEKENQLIVIEEYLTGQNLEEILQGQSISEREAALIVIQLCRALKPLHHAEPAIICRDLKAANVMITLDKEVKIIDFDIARTYQTGKSCDTKLMGTKEYAAPEQYGFRQTDARTDIYALGVLLNYMILRKFPTEELVSGRLRQIVCKCLEMNPDDRYQTVDELENVLDALYYDVKKEKPVTGNDTKRDRRNKSYALPGFRSHTWWKTLSAILGYVLITMLAFSLELTTGDTKLTGIRLRYEQSIIWIMQIAMIFLVWNYRGIRDDLPLVRDNRKSIRMIGYVVAEIILLFVGLLFVAASEPFLF